MDVQDTHITDKLLLLLLWVFIVIVTVSVLLYHFRSSHAANREGYMNYILLM